MNESNLNTQTSTMKLAKMGMLTAISIVLVALIRFPFPLLPILEYDPADISIMIGAFAFGPLAGLTITVVVAVIQGMLFSTTGPYGIVMHIIATGVFVIVSGLIYRKHKTKKAALIALIAGTLAMTAVMVPANYIITPLYFQMPRAAVVPMLPAVALFNLMKAGINSAVTFILYKRISTFLHK